mgnify:CR=1 FL=1
MCVRALRIASYSRVSYDEDKERYESIINQKNIVKDYAKEHFTNYNIIEFETVGRTYSERKKKTIMGSPVTSQITIGERTLFSLE